MENVKGYVPLQDSVSDTRIEACKLIPHQHYEMI